MDVDEDTKYLLLGLYGMCMVFAVVGCAYLLDPVKTYVASTSSCGQIITQISSVLKCILDKRFLLICGLLMYSTMQLAFVTAEVTKAFVTCPVGIFMVGYCMIVYGVCGGTTSFIGGRLTKYIGRIPLIVAAAISNLGLLAFMVFWRPDSDQIVAFLLLMGAWGLGDGIWLSQVNCIISAIFPEKLEEAFAASRTLQGLGGAIVMGYATQLCMISKMGILAGACIFGTSMYIVAEMISRRKQDNIDEEKSLTKA
ncbi:hypothetical protein FSP39_009079 [Pinctada imbricata]|uniref:UNC93-like protein n=1 Tax=Pinctada imbricata TaxID=66713 RepID=A0AA89BX43_PINIB|nr:hypothetical protein FSP39_009079 [Pinctada imbricata]